MDHCDPKLISLAVDGELDATARARFEDHLARCEACRRTRDDFLALRARVRDAAAPADAVAQKRVLRDILAARPEPFWRRRIAVPAPAFAALVAALAVALAVALAGRRGERDASPPAAPAAVASDLSRFDRGNRLEIYVARHGREQEH